MAWHALRKNNKETFWTCCQMMKLANNQQRKDKRMMCNDVYRFLAICYGMSVKLFKDYKLETPPINTK